LPNNLLRVVQRYNDLHQRNHTDGPADNGDDTTAASRLPLGPFYLTNFKRVSGKEGEKGTVATTVTVIEFEAVMRGTDASHSDPVATISLSIPSTYPLGLPQFRVSSKAISTGAASLEKVLQRGVNDVFDKVVLGPANQQGTDALLDCTLSVQIHLLATLFRTWVELGEGTWGGESSTVLSLGGLGMLVEENQPRSDDRSTYWVLRRLYGKQE